MNQWVVESILADWGNGKRLKSIRSLPSKKRKQKKYIAKIRRRDPHIDKIYLIYRIPSNRNK